MKQTVVKTLGFAATILCSAIASSPVVCLRGGQVCPMVPAGPASAGRGALRGTGQFDRLLRLLQPLQPRRLFRLVLGPQFPRTPRFMRRKQETSKVGLQPAPRRERGLHQRRRHYLLGLVLPLARKIHEGAGIGFSGGGRVFQGRFAAIVRRGMTEGGVLNRTSRDVRRCSSRLGVRQRGATLRVDSGVGSRAMSPGDDPSGTAPRACAVPIHRTRPVEGVDHVIVPSGRAGLDGRR